MVPIWERVWRKADLVTLLRKFRFTADESVHLEVWVSESSVGWSQLQGLHSRSSPVRVSAFPLLLLCLLSPSFFVLLSFH